MDPFAHVTLRENELLGISGNSLDYYSIKGTTAIDSRSNNLTNFESLEKILLIYIRLLKVFTYKTEKIKLIIHLTIMMTGEV